MINLIQRAENYPQRIAIKSEGKSYAYQQLLDASENIAIDLLLGKDDLQEERIAFLVQPGFDYTAIQWGIWRAGGIAVPLCVKHPFSSIAYVIEDTSASVVICSSEFEVLLSPLKNKSGIRFLSSNSFSTKKGSLPPIPMNRRAMILYTSGTTGNPKGVVSTHDNIETQITTLTTSWEWSKDDHILNVLPLHHVHGIINVMSCALWSGACCEFLPKFSADKIFEICC